MKSLLFANRPSSFQKIAIALLLLIFTFATLVPGGPIETRDFSHLSPVVFWGFNAFLISLAIAISLFLHFFILSLLYFFTLLSPRARMKYC